MTGQEGKRKSERVYRPWWLYMKKEETDRRAVYSYARESRTTDGEIAYDKITGEIRVTRPCERDLEEKWSIAEAEDRFQVVIRQGLPETSRVTGD